VFIINDLPCTLFLFLNSRALIIFNGCFVFSGMVILRTYYSKQQSKYIKKAILVIIAN